MLGAKFNRPSWIICGHRSYRRYLRIRIGNSLNSELKNNYIDDDLKVLTWYSCGPTVYDVAHLGHARTYVCTDIIRRILTDYFGYTINFAMGITDIDDKIMHKARDKGLKNKKEIKSMTSEIERNFFNDLQRLNVRQPDAVLRVTEHMDEIRDYIDRLMKNGSAYTASDGVYFDVAKMGSAYGKLGGVPASSAEELIIDATLDRRTSTSSVLNSSSTATDHGEENGASSRNIRRKKDWRDFALWKFAALGDPCPEAAWDSPWGRGRPGWHIECSAVTHTYFGTCLDMHSGGVDLKFPHHTNEIAQCEAHNKQDWVRVWLHTGHLYIQGRKMSKSLKNFVSIASYLNLGDMGDTGAISLCDESTPGSGDTFSSHTHSSRVGAQNSGDQMRERATDFRVFCLQHHYSSSVHFCRDRIEEAARFRRRIENLLQSVASLSREANSEIDDSRDSEEYWGKEKETAASRELRAALTTAGVTFRTSLSDDFDTPAALKSLASLCSDASNYISLIRGASNNSSQPMLVLQATADFIVRSLSILGVNIQHQRQGTHDDGGTVKLDDAIHSLVSFRSRVRSASLVGLKKIKSAGRKGGVGTKGIGDITRREEDCEEDRGGHQEGKEALEEVLAACDEARDEALRKLGLRIDDNK